MGTILLKVLIMLLLTYILEAIYIFVNLMSAGGHIKFVNKNKEIELKGLKMFGGITYFFSMVICNNRRYKMIIISQDKMKIYNFDKIFRLCVDSWEMK